MTIEVTEEHMLAALKFVHDTPPGSLGLVARAIARGRSFELGRLRAFSAVNGEKICRGYLEIVAGCSKKTDEAKRLSIELNLKTTPWADYIARCRRYAAVFDHLGHEKALFFAQSDSGPESIDKYNSLVRGGTDASFAFSVACIKDSDAKVALELKRAGFDDDACIQIASCKHRRQWFRELSQLAALSENDAVRLALAGIGVDALMAFAELCDEEAPLLDLVYWLTVVGRTPDEYLEANKVLSHEQIMAALRVEPAIQDASTD